MFDEIDYILEAKNAERFASLYGKLSKFVVTVLLLRQFIDIFCSKHHISIPGDAG